FAQLLRADSTNDSAPLRRNVGTRFTANAPWTAADERTATRAGDFPPDGASGRLRRCLEQVFARRLRRAPHTERPTAQVQWQYRRRRRAPALDQRGDCADERFAGDRANRQLFDG